MAELRIVNPIALAQAATPRANRFPPAARPQTLEGKTIGLFWNSKAGGEIGLTRTKELLQRLYPTSKFREYFGEHGTFARRASNAQFDSMAKDCAAVVGATAD
ncbi:MAG: hypothetical protein FJ039_08380 [Chloroflexi bacterium]|nr:hypothetical protein [Chloroflexota bacterium]